MVAAPWAGGGVALLLDAAMEDRGAKLAELRSRGASLPSDDGQSAEYHRRSVASHRCDCLLRRRAACVAARQPQASVLSVLATTLLTLLLYYRLLLASILKLFVWDLRRLETLPRIFSFIVLGAILLGVSWI